MGYGYDPEETTGQEHMDGTAPESGGQEYTDSAQKTDASDTSDTPAGFVPHAQNASSAANSTKMDRINSLVRMILPPFPYALR